MLPSSLTDIWSSEFPTPNTFIKGYSCENDFVQDSYASKSSHVEYLVLSELQLPKYDVVVAHMLGSLLLFSVSLVLDGLLLSYHGSERFKLIKLISQVGLTTEFDLLA